ncbi:hypothetical protein [Tomitella gaofuii]|uniref:hypothetical protein n=1 Tax=Tomitella gaofuii TaxID=2760083 RepID=UPI0015FA311A|nr:hypothetical protein [Tomitella gaofuii]
MIRVDDNGEHQYATVADLPSAPPAHPWTLHLADEAGSFHLLGFDFDDHDGSRAGDVARDVDTLTTWCDQHDVPHLVCASGGGAGRHVWIRLTGPADADRVTDMARALGLLLPTLDIAPLCNAGTGMLRAPSSPHRHGGHSTPLPTGGRDAAEQVAYASRGTSPDVVELLCNWTDSRRPANAYATGAEQQVRTIDYQLRRLDGPHFDLPPKIKALAEARVTTRQDGSRITWRILLAAAHAGWAYSDVLAAADEYPGLIHLTHRRGPNGSRIPRRRPARHIARQWNRALGAAAAYRPSDHQNRPPVDDYLAAALAAVHAHPQLARGTHAAALRVVLYALITTMRSAHTLEVDLSMRRWALLCGSTKSSVCRDVAALIDLGVITRIARGRGTHADTYTLTIIPAQPVPGTQGFPPAASPTLEEAAGMLAHHSQDVFTSDQLGAAAAQVHHALLTDERASVASLATSVGLDERTCQELVARLRAVRLIVPSHLEAVDSEPMYAAAARRLGVYGELRRRERQYRAESAVWAWWCDELVWRGAKGPKPRAAWRVRLGRFPTTEDGRCNWPAAVRRMASRLSWEDATAAGRVRAA